MELQYHSEPPMMLGFLSTVIASFHCAFPSQETGLFLFSWAPCGDLVVLIVVLDFVELNKPFASSLLSTMVALLFKCGWWWQFIEVRHWLACFLLIWSFPFNEVPASLECELYTVFLRTLFLRIARNSWNDLSTEFGISTSSLISRMVDANASAPWTDASSVLMKCLFGASHFVVFTEVRRITSNKIRIFRWHRLISS